MRFVVVIKAVAQPVKDQAVPAGGVAAGWAQLHREMVEAGVLAAGGGLAPPETGARLTITGDEVIVMGGPFAETTEVLTGVWVLQVPSQEEALKWVRRIPGQANNLIQVELRAITEDPADSTPA